MNPMNRQALTGRVLLATAALVLAAGTWWLLRETAPSTDNAYVQGEVTSLAPKVGGYIVDVRVEDNQEVAAGDVLFSIDDADYRAHLQQASATVDAARARIESIDAEAVLQRHLVAQAEAQRRATASDLKLATSVSNRRRELIVGNAVSQAQLDEAVAALSRAKEAFKVADGSLAAQRQRVAVLASQRRAAVAAVAQAEAARELARRDLGSTVVRAPVSGVVGNRRVRVGRLVSPGVVLLDIVPIRTLWVVANFKETQIAPVRVGQRARITIDGFPDATFEGVVDSFAPGSGSAFSLLPADNATGNFVRVVQRVPVKIRFAGDASPPRLVPGLSARVRLYSGGGQ